MLRLPITAAAATLLVFNLAELWLSPFPTPLGERLAVQAVVLGTFLALPRAPLLVYPLLLAEIFALKAFEISEKIGNSTFVLLPFAATFVAAALVPARRLWLLAGPLVAFMAWRTTMHTGSVSEFAGDCALYGGALLTGALLQRRHRRLNEIRTERDRLVDALETGPADAATAEQLRLWSVLEQRIEPVIAALPDLVERARHAPEQLEAIRARAADALAEMQATLRTLGDGPPPADRPLPADATPSPAHVSPPHDAALPPRRPRRARTLSPLPLACALLLVAAIVEMVAAGEVSPYAVALSLFPLLAPRRPVTAALLVAGTALACSLDGGIPVAARAIDFSAILVLLVAGATASPPRAAASLVLVMTGVLVSMGVDPTREWPAVLFVASALVYLANWIFGVLLRGVAAEQRLTGAIVAEAEAALAELEARAVRRERVRLAHELHDLVGHALTAVAIQAGVAQARIRHGLEPAFEPLEAAARQGVEELQRLATVLGHDTDVLAELARVTDTARATGQQVELQLGERVGELDPQVRHTVVCVTAEALTNAAKHAAGSLVHVKLQASDDRLELAVVDDGGRTRDLPSGGRGMDSMAQRVRACGGTFASGPRPGGGWSVQAVLPLSM